MGGAKGNAEDEGETMTTTNNPAICATILKQMGGTGRLSAMLGAKHFIDHGNGASFKFPNRRGPNYCKIVLDPSDTYTVTFGKIRKYELTKPQEHTGIYADMLRELFEKTTGLYLSL